MSVTARETGIAEDPPLLITIPIGETDDVDDFRSRLQRFGVTSVDVPRRDGFRARGLYLHLNKIGLLYSALSRTTRIEFPESGFARQLLVLSGRSTSSDGRRTADLDTGQTGISSPYHGSRFACSDEYAQLMLRIDRAELETQLQLIIGRRSPQLLEFERAADLSDPLVRQHCELVTFVARQCFAATPPPEPVLRELEQAVTLSLLYSIRHNFSEQMQRQDRRIGPRHLRVAEEYIEANWQQSITIRKLVAVTGVSARALFRAFLNDRGTTPLAFAKQVRLRHAHRMLQSGEPGLTVTEVAMNCGFGNLGHFARDYRGLFGELPSQTARRRRF